MQRMRIWLSRVAELLFRGRREGRLSSEIEHHLDLLTDELKHTGLSEREARVAAQRQFGGVEQLRMAHREQRGLPRLDSLTQDVRFALRVLARDRGFALTAIVVLGVGLGVNNMFFTLLHAHKFRGLPVEDVDRVLFMSTIDDRASDRPLSPPEFDDLLASQTSFTSLGAYVPGVVTVGDEGRSPERADVAYVTASVFEVLRIAPLIGRVPDATHDRPGGTPLVLLSSEIWRARYDGDPEILGRSVLINGSAVTVVGIIRDRSGFPTTASVWMPLGQQPEWKPDRAVRSLRVVGRLRQHASEDSARSEVEAFFDRLEQAHPETNRQVRARVVTLNARLLGTLDGWMQFIYAGIIVLLVACANVANLMLARSVHRAPEIAIRTSLGASRSRVVWQLMVEAAIVAGGGAIVGGLVSLIGVRAIEAGIPDGILPYWFDYTMDRTVFGVLVGLSLVTIVVFGLLPALHASRTDINRTLKDGGRSATAAPSTRVWTSAFLTVQLALAAILLAQVAVQSYLADQSIPTDANINTDAVMTAGVTLPTSSYPDATQRTLFFARLDERMRSRSEIVAYSRATILPGEGGSQRQLQIRGREHPAGTALPTVLTIEVAPGYFASLALGVLRGRDFTTNDGTADRRVAIVNERFAEVFLAERDSMNVEIAVTAPNVATSTSPPWTTIVGIAPTIRQQDLRGGEQQSPVVYLPIARSAPATSFLVVRHRADLASVGNILRAETQAVDPNVPLYRMRSLARAVRDAQWNRHTSAVLAETVTLMSVLVAVVGLYAVTTQRVRLRAREIGLRMALGARSLHIAGMIIGGLRIPLLLGLLLGAAGSMAWDGAYSSGVAGVYASAPPTLLTVAALLVGFVILACSIPLRRATTTNPVTALRRE